jgi:UDP-N-acetylmuramate dehydrogenase
MRELPEDLLSIPHRRDVPFSSLTTLGIGGVCKWLFEPATEDEAALFVRTCYAEDIEYGILGGGSNLLVLSDVHWPVMRLRLPRKLTATPSGVFACASHSHVAVARDVANMGLSGLEWAAGIPGSVGGALRMNAGAFGKSWSMVVDRVRFLSQTGEMVEKKPAEDDFAYRSSFLGGGRVALGAYIKLARGDSASIKKAMAKHQATRRGEQPKGRSAGCVFKNPPGKNAGHLIDSAGMKGTRVGEAVVSETHANFFLNLGGATPKDYMELIRLVRARVFDAHGTKLELEVDVWGGRLGV